MKKTLHVSPKMFRRMTDASEHAKLNNLDPVIAAMKVTGCKWEIFDEFIIKVDLEDDDIFDGKASINA